MRRLREARGLTQEDLAARAQLSVERSSAIERGEIDADIYSLYKIAVALDCTLDNLVLGLGVPSRISPRTDSSESVGPE